MPPLPEQSYAHRPWDAASRTLYNLERVTQLRDAASVRRNELVDQAHDAGASTKDIAAAAGVSTARVWQILNRRPELPAPTEVRDAGV